MHYERRTVFEAVLHGTQRPYVTHHGLYLVVQDPVSDAMRGVYNTVAECL